jgi:hypothetical protein
MAGDRARGPEAMAAADPTQDAGATAAADRDRMPADPAQDAGAHGRS